MKSSPKTLREFGRRLRRLINRPDVIELLSSGDWGQGGCWALAEAVERFLGAPAELVAISSETMPVEHVLVSYADTYIDYNGHQTLRELEWNLTEDPHYANRGELSIVPFTEKLKRLARKYDIRCDPVVVKALTKKLHEEFPSR